MRDAGGLIAVLLATLAAAPARPCAPLALQPALAAPAPGDIYLRAAAATCSTLDVEVTAVDLPGLFTISFDLRYPAAALAYDGYAAGPVFARGAPRTAPLVLVQNPAPGTLRVTITRFAPDAAVAAVGAEGLITLRFRRSGTGTGSIDFDLTPTSPITETILDDLGRTVRARFSPGHGARVTVPRDKSSQLR